MLPALVTYTAALVLLIQINASPTPKPAEKAPPPCTVSGRVVTSAEGTGGRVCSFRGRATRSAPQLENLVIRHSIGAPFSQLAKHLDYAHHGRCAGHLSVMA